MDNKMPVILRNIDLAPFSFELQHDIVCIEGLCECTTHVRTGLGGKPVERSYPKHVSIPGRGGLSEPLPEAVLRLGPVARRMKEGRLLKLPGRAKVVEIEPTER